MEKEKTLKLLEEGKITISKGAEILKISVWDFVLFVKEKSIIWNKNNDFIISDIKKKM